MEYVFDYIINGSIGNARCQDLNYRDKYKQFYETGIGKGQKHKSEREREDGGKYTKDHWR